MDENTNNPAGTPVDDQAVAPAPEAIEEAQNEGIPATDEQAAA